MKPSSEPFLSRRDTSSSVIVEELDNRKEDVKDAVPQVGCGSWRPRHYKHSNAEKKGERWNGKIREFEI